MIIAERFVDDRVFALRTKVETGVAVARAGRDKDRVGAERKKALE
jgi:hypothetical protein